MAKLIKSVMGGVVAKSIRCYVFLEPKFYQDVVSEAKATGINFRTDSELMTKICQRFLHDLPLANLQIDQLKRAAAEKEQIIIGMENKINDQKIKTKSRKKKSK